MKNTKLMLAAGAVMALGMLSGCGGGHGSSSGTARPVIIIHNGYFGYYTNTIWCDWTNDYCGTGTSYGIVNSGCGFNGFSCVDPGSFVNGSGNGSFGGGTTTVNGSGNGFGGFTGGTTTNGSGSGFSVGGDTKDVDLQRADLQQQNFNDRAQGIAQQFGMNAEAARQLVQLSDRMQALTASGMADADRAALADAALSVAGINSDEVSAAYAKMLKDGDQGAVNALLEKGAANLGMTNTAALRDQILPSLGITLK